MAGAPPGRTIVVLFRHDLRMHDNPVLQAAVEEAAHDAAGAVIEVVPLYCFDPQQWGHTPSGSPRVGPVRAAFLLQSLAALRTSLRAIGSDLLACNCAPGQAVSELLAVPRAAGRLLTVLTQQEVTSEETDADAAVQAILATAEGGGELRRVWGSSLVHLDDLPFHPAKEMPPSFTKFRKAVEDTAVWQVRDAILPPRPRRLPLPPDGLPQLPAAFWPESPTDLAAIPGCSGAGSPNPCEQAVMRWEGGEEAALQRVQHYVWDTTAASSYFETRNGLLEADDSTKLSAWLAVGCLSPRHVWREVRRMEGERGSNHSTTMLTFHLLVRDYWRFFAMHHGTRIFQAGGVARERRPWRGGSSELQRWQQGTTGVPFVDANMRELLHTGWMSNRGRQNVASYLALDVGADWRQGAEWFQALLVDHDVCSNWGNWVCAAGLGGSRGSRFDVLKQSRDYDPQGEYIYKWVPELGKVPPEHVHAPWRMTTAQQLACGVTIPGDYPEPLLGTRYTEE
mmetsp:Transcript_19302/g.58317  ORF Transcript_19302/g.58317 Transcript_19302/m.58317 type:complete len:509 (-) Transcript_19302:411-1937(-)|eukprot:CAMPEP_0206137490 /NCGR_PEP_ID=MMETSP1473-20131121/2613_1 /ASSEMBLY_ACC=CAM_ASM_001109 /TAXON_ID=1461547 /ORGANISM="Stichococcus sp, Strain RCC1054" /LENGTH=508 /DNA_ID=CAMNT_0053530613 /DNA_START=244 /DNA_END=1770 /DNA_ORIENTATION=-